MTTIFTALASAAAAFFGSWVAAHFALNRFYRERIWERRAAAYTAIFDALYDIESWIKQALLHELHGTEVEDEFKFFLEANNSLARRTASETWLLSDRFRSVIERYTGEQFPSETDAKEMLGQMVLRIRRALAELREIARSDLSVK